MWVGAAGETTDRSATAEEDRFFTGVVTSLREQHTLFAEDGAVRGPEQGEIFPGLARASSAASTGTTLAVTLPDAHFVYLVGLTGARVQVDGVR